MAAVAFLVSAPADGVAQTDLSGMWILTVESGQGANPLPVTIVQDGESLTATGEIPDLGPIEMTGTIDGSEVTFEWVVDAQGMEIVIVLRGAVADDGTISGTADCGGFAQGDWSAKRADS
jgi:hypothetical protein